MSAPRRFPPARHRIIGPIVLAVADWSRPQPGPTRMFDQPWLEAVSKVHPAVLPLIFVPLAGWVFWYGLTLGLPLGLSVVLTGGGLALWSLLEYLIHRFSFHFTPRNRFGIIAAYLVHGIHHAYPEDHRGWVTPPVLSVPISLALYFSFRLVLGPYVNPIACGVALGYLTYDLTHYVLHRGPLKSRIGRYLRSHHLQHHFATPERRFGVSSPFWDYVFRTHK